jgi:uncharacterized protein (DUF885 family)
MRRVADEQFQDTPRRVADAYVAAMVALDPMLATALGLPDGADRFPDLSPAGAEAEAGLQRETLRRLAAAESAAGPDGLDPQERRCARLLRERLEAALALHEAGEHLRAVRNLASPAHAVRQAFTLMPVATGEDWDAIGARMAKVPEAIAQYRTTLEAGVAQQLLAGPAQVRAMLEQLDAWVAGEPGGWFAQFAAKAPDGHRSAAGAAPAAGQAVAQLREYLAEIYTPAAEKFGADPVGRERYARWARYWTGADLDLQEAYDWGWQEFIRLDGELRAETERVLPGATPLEAMRHLDRDGEVVEGEETARAWLQALTDSAIEALHGVHFDIADPLRRVETVIAPPGSAAAPFYTRPAMDFSRPGKTWLSTMGETRFPLWGLVSTWYHEGVPGHHLQLGQWVLVAPQLSQYQASLGSVSANVEGWALYAERLMDELGFLTDPGHRIGYLDAQQMRAIRVIADIGMHLGLEIPHDQGAAEPFRPGERWTPALVREFFGRNSGRPAGFLDSELVRYLGWPGQAIGYKLGERAWLAGREGARAAHGAGFDLKAWHMAALSLGSLGLDDLVDELTQL